MKNNVCLILYCLFALSCSKDTNLNENIDILDTDESYEKSLLISLYSGSFNFIDLDKIFLVKKNSLGRETVPKLSYSGLSQGDGVEHFIVNGFDVPGTSHRYFKQFSNAESKLNINDTYTLNVGGNISTLKDVEITFLPHETEVNSGAVFSWEFSNDYDGPTLVVLKQNALLSSGEILNNTKSEIIFVEDSSIEITSTLLSKFSNNDEVTIYIFAANYDLTQNESCIAAVTSYDSSTGTLVISK